ncbi:MAG TPA: serine/threonine-protein kinase [Vicinamibacterales bacterium]|nr:serine/threonine-protein kinase [Vicinamibacterales bacterium]
MVGQNIGKYRVLDRVGRGGMGTVYKAIDETLHREVAIKVLNAELNDPEIAKRFRAEAITVARLSHPGIATIYELFQHEGQWLMVMEFVRGETLEHMVDRMGPLSPQRAAELCMQSLAALAHAHSMGVVHRDLKPANLMITENGTIKIMDFGIARVAGTEHLTNAGFMMGTPAYMAPEQVMGHEIDARADLYALGVVFYRLTTAKLPFKGDTPFAMAQSQVNDPPIPISSHRHDLPPWADLLITRALAKSPEERFQSAVEFHEAFARCMAGLPMLALYSSSAPTEVMMTPSRPLSTGSISRTNPSLHTPTAPAYPMPPPAAPSGATSRQPEDDSFAPTIAAATPPMTGTGPMVADPETPTTASPVPPLRAAGSAAAPKPAPPPPAGPAPSATKGNGAIIGVAAAVLLIAAVGGVFFWRSRTTTPPQPPEATTPAPAPATPPPPTEPPPASGAASAPAPGSTAPGSTPADATAPGTTPPATGAAPATPGAPGATPPGRAGARGTTPTTTTTTPPGTTPPATPTTPATSPTPGRGATSVEEPAVFTGSKILLVNGRRASDEDVSVRFGEGQIAVLAKDSNSLLASMPYSSVAGATFVDARDPKWDPSLFSPPANLDMPGFIRTAKRWLVVQARDSFLILRLDDGSWRRVIETFEARTGKTVQRPR